MSAAPACARARLTNLRHQPHHQSQLSQPVRASTRPFTSTSARLADDDEGSAEGQQRVRMPRAPTSHRRRMYMWLNGPGKAFVSPLAKSTNYLSAYNRDGQLRRLAKARQQGQNEDEDAEKDESIDGAEDLEEAAREDAEEGEDGRSRRSGRPGKNVLPTEGKADLRPFPQNPYFRSQSVLGEELRDEIYKAVQEKGESVSAVSARLKIDMRRVAAVVRLKAVEKRWIDERKPLATPYAKAVLAMLPQTKLNKDSKREQPEHESINDLPVHPSTHQQIFWPTSESRHFTRSDAAKVFSPTLLPADERIPHPELIPTAASGTEDLREQGRRQMADRLRQKAQEEREEKLKKHEAWEARNVKVVEGQRWDFKFQSVRAEAVGRDGRGSGAAGWRYGVPLGDRKRGHLKDVPLAVET